MLIRHRLVAAAATFTAVAALVAACTPTPAPPATTAPPQPPATTTTVRPPTTAAPTTTPTTAAPTTTAPTTTTTAPSGAQVSYRAGASFNGNVTFPSVTVPPQVRAGDLLVLFATSASTAPTYTTPAGWTRIGGDTDATANIQTHAYTKVATSADLSAAVTVTGSSQAKVALDLVAYSGGAGVSAHAVAVRTTSSATHSTPSVAVGTAGSAVVSYWSDRTSTNTSWATSAGVTPRTSSVGSGSGYILSASADRLSVAAGTSAGVTATTQNATARAAVWSVAINPSPTAPTTTAPPAAWSSQYAGDVRPGNVRVGASNYWTTNSANIAARYETLGKAMGVHRIFSGTDNWSATDKLSVVTASANAGRIPWISYKPPVLETATTNAQDATIDALIANLKAVNKPVWLTVWHEPEDQISGDASWGANFSARLANYKAVQVKFRQALDRANATNIAFAPVYMDWTFHPDSGRTASNYLAPAGTHDFLGVDFYVKRIEAGPIGSGTEGTAYGPLRTARQFAQANGWDLAIGEYGNFDHSTDAEHVAIYDYFRGSATDGEGAQVTAVAYFDGLGPSGDWSMPDPSPTLTKWRQLVAASTSPTNTQN